MIMKLIVSSFYLVFSLEGIGYYGVLYMEFSKKLFLFEFDVVRKISQKSV